ncbi:CFI-box-CTERM domain-containing protein [Nitrosopumilus piranensis]|uniref:Peptidylprolyl isomerase n=1 Tax=Nitrosopumilus piranensis TaxID=1582439 RepID=A0A0C5BSH2_9ARCH|nr:CFI-box-CTERM domain-containing protein [Nitrosopumilus piranensis]AJM91256.1 conserved exported protein of unknown function [Nitrosopumilus piranensis]
MKLFLLIFFLLSFSIFITNAYSISIIDNSDSHSFKMTDLIQIKGQVNEKLYENKIAVEIFSPSGYSSLSRMVEVHPDGHFELLFYANYTHGRFSPDGSGIYDILGTVLTKDGPITLPITSIKLDLEPTIKQNSTNTNSEGGGCLIASATYDTEMAPQIQFLREIRDNKIMNTESGAFFIEKFNKFYYSFSPSVADYQRENPIFKEMIKIGIAPMISSLHVMSFANSNEEVMIYGIIVILINIGTYFIFPTLLIFKLKPLVTKLSKNYINF